MVKKLDHYRVDLFSLVKEFEEHILDLLLPHANPGVIQRSYHLIMGYKESNLLRKLPYTILIAEEIKKFFPYRDLSVVQLQPNMAYNWHIDGCKTSLHIPIITNEGCRFVYDNICFFMPANGSVYQVINSIPHTFVNASKFPRTHLIFFGK